MVRALWPAEEGEFYGIGPEYLAPAGRKVFLDRASADRHAEALTARALRTMRATRYGGNPGAMSDAEFCREVGTILGIPYQLPGRKGDTIFPEWTTDAQLATVGGDVDRFDRELRPDLVARVIADNQRAGVEPTLWKVEGLETVEAARHVAGAARAGQRDTSIAR